MQLKQLESINSNLKGNKSSAQELTEYKKLLDAKVITQEELMLK